MSSGPVEVPFVDLRAGYRDLRDEVLAAVDAALEGMQLFLGPNVAALEREFAEYCEADFGVGVSSGTDALQAALSACGVGPGDEVVLPAHTFFASVEAVVHLGAVPVFADVEPDNLTLDPVEVEKALGPATRAILPVHLYGEPVDMDPLLEIARSRGLRVVEDASQAHGARYRGRRCGSLGDAGCFSFYFTKNLGAYGEGGFVATGDPQIAERVRLLRNHGHVSKFEHALVGHNFRLDEIQAAILRVKLRRLDGWLARRSELARRYGEALRGDGLLCPVARPDCEPAHHLYPIRIPSRDALIAHLRSVGIETGIHYRHPAHRQPALRDVPHRVRPLPVTEAACTELLSLPLYPELRDEQQALVIREVRAFREGRTAAAARA